MVRSFVSFMLQLSVAQAFTPGTRETPFLGLSPLQGRDDAALAPKGAEENWEGAPVPQA